MNERTDRLGIFTGCCLISVGANAYFIASASIVPLLIAEFSIDKPSAGMAISAAVFGTVLFQLPGGFLMDRYDNRQLLTLGMVVFAPIAIVGAFMQTYLLFLVSRFFAGTAAGALFVLGANIVSQVFAGSRQGFVTTVYIASAPLGFAISQFAGPPIASTFGWRTVFIVYPVLSFLGFTIFWLSRPRPIRSGGAISIREFGLALRNPSVILVSISGFCSYALYIFMNSWMPTYATESLPVSLNEAGAITALLPAIGLVARPVGGWLSDSLGYRRRLIVIVSLLFAFPAFFVISHAGSPLLFATVMLGVGFSLQFGQGVYYVYARELADYGTGGTSLALFTMIAFCGTLVSPAVGGWLIGAASWGTTFVIYALVGVVGVLVLLFSADSSPDGVN